jgi:hypothetical protein
MNQLDLHFFVQNVKHYLITRSTRYIILENIPHYIIEIISSISFGSEEYQYLYLFYIIVKISNTWSSFI